MRAVSFIVVLSLLGGCFVHDAHRRRMTKYAEGGAIVGGIVLLSVTGSGADCMNTGPADREAYDSCRSRATVMGDAGLALILGGLLGFAFTQMTAPAEPAPLAPLASEPEAAPKKPAKPTRAAATR